MPIQQKNVFPFLLVGLPVGLLVLGIGSMLYTELLDTTPAGHADDEARERTRGFAQLLRKPVNADDLKRYVTLLSEDIGERNMQKSGALESAALLIESSMGPSNMGYKIQRQVYEAGDGEVRNVVAELKGRSKPEEIVVIGAHYDSAVGALGKIDNATGVAALLSLANAFVATENERTLRFVGFVNGEAPYFQTKDMGSLVYAEDCKAKRENIVAMIALDSLGVSVDQFGTKRMPQKMLEGREDAGEFVFFGGNAASNDLVNSARAAFVSSPNFTVMTKGKSEPVADYEASDHWSLWRNDYPAIVVTDLFPLSNSKFQVEAGHVDYGRLEKLAIGLTAVVESLVNPE